MKPGIDIVKNRVHVCAEIGVKKCKKFKITGIHWNSLDSLEFRYLFDFGKTKDRNRRLPGKDVSVTRLHPVEGASWIHKNYKKDKILNLDMQIPIYKIIKCSSS